MGFIYDFRFKRSVADQIFRSARTPNGWADRPVEDTLVREAYDLMKWGPTSANSSPARFVWVGSARGKSRLAALAAPTNAPKILAAPVTVIVGYDLDFAEQLPKLFPARGKDMQAYYSDPRRAIHRFSQQQPSGRLSDCGGARVGTRLRSNVWLQQRGGGFRILCKYTHQIQFHLLHRVRIE